MRAGAFWRDKALHLACLGGAVLLSAALLYVLQVDRQAVAFVCALTLFGGLIPLAAEFFRKRSFYRNTLELLEQLEPRYLLSELLEDPEFWEGTLLCQVLAACSKAMNDAVSDARREAGEYREYVEAWVHEVKTPIAAGRLALENAPGPLADSLDTALFQIEGYVEQALFYARSGAVERDYLIRPVPLREAAANTVKRFARPLIAAGFSVDLETLDAVAYTDPKWVEFMLGQLVSNALKYRGASPRLTFSQRVEEQAVVLTVADNGQGIPAADLPRVWEKGFTGKNGRALATRSTGLGLYLCKKLCGRLDVGLSIRSAVGEGTAVSLTFPKGRFYLMQQAGESAGRAEIGADGGRGETE